MEYLKPGCDIHKCPRAILIRVADMFKWVTWYSSSQSCLLDCLLVHRAEKDLMTSSTWIWLSFTHGVYLQSVWAFQSNQSWIIVVHSQLLMVIVNIYGKVGGKSRRICEAAFVSFVCVVTGEGGWVYGLCWAVLSCPILMDWTLESRRWEDSFYSCCGRSHFPLLPGMGCVCGAHSCCPWPPRGSTAVLWKMSW